ncbi:hypothetical protein KPL78_06515 [Roseomonas sp. HJA6]|uniref:Uncharacterized protein n=1 Tax=Roseomonas alba TaxID=2846776 RepID=A0ABS7A5F1_9PROT|nr:hypothetical protein [Neoroseomonas alba]MBW6397491.1 hypothetical protein [Neoroseomonas alba]
MSATEAASAPPVSRQQRRAMERAERKHAMALPAAALVRRFLTSAGQSGGDEAMRLLAPHLRVPMLLALRRMPDVSREVIQDAIEELWLSQHAALLRAIPDAGGLRALFIGAAYPVPDDMPEAFPIYRGSCGVPAEKAALGMSWTTDPDTAAHHAFQKRREGWGDPCVVLRAEARREQVIFSSDDMGCNEVILDAAPEAWEVVEMPMEAMADAADRNLEKIRTFAEEVAAGLHGFSPAARRFTATAKAMMRRAAR